MELRFPEGYYVAGASKHKCLLRIEHYLAELPKLFYLVQVVAVSQSIPKEERDVLLDNTVTYRSFLPKGIILVPAEETNTWQLSTPLSDEEVTTIKLLYGDQSAAGTTVEAATLAKSTVSDAKSGGGHFG